MTLCLTDPYAPNLPHSPSLASTPKTIAPASTVLFVPLSQPPSNIPSNIPKETHYVDHTRSGTIVVLSQPPNQYCAVLGGIMATRMKVLGAVGVVADGRVRDLDELKEVGLPVYARGTSTVGTGAQAKPWALDVPVTIGEVTIQPVCKLRSLCTQFIHRTDEDTKGDIVFADPSSGVVVIPQEKLDQVLELLPKLVKADEKVIEFVREGGSVKEAFTKFR